MTPGPGIPFEPVTCFAVEDHAGFWLETDLDITTVEGWMARYNVGAVLDKRRSDGEGSFYVCTPLGPVNLNRPELRWDLSGTAPRWTATPSIKVGPTALGDERATFTWHGWLRDGVLTGAWE